MKASIALLGASAQLGWGLVAPVPSPTNAAAGEVDLYGFTPKPTTVARLHPDLLKRQGAGQTLLGYALPDNTCGYVSGSLGASKTCDATQQCAAVQIGNIATLGCCDLVGDSCQWYGDCVNYSEYYSASAGCDQACKQDANTVKCTNSAKPYCYPYLVPSISIGFFSCDSTSTTGWASFLSTFKGETDARSWSPLYDTLSGSSSKIKTASVGSTGAFSTIAGGGAATTSSSSSASTTVGTDGSSSGGTISKTKTKKTPIGAIVGGVVGGLAVIGGIIAAAIATLMKKKNKGTSPPPASAADAANMNNAPAAGPDMRQSMYGQQPPPQGYPQPQGPYPPPQQQYPQQYPPQQQQQQQFDLSNNGAPNPGFFAAAKYDQNNYGKQDGPQVTEQSVPVTPMPPTSPAPPYVQPVQQGGHESWGQTPISPPTASPPQMMQGAYQPPQQPLQPQGPAPVELGTNFSTPQRNAEGRPVYEAA